MKHSKEFDAFTSLVDRVLAVPHSVIQTRVAEAREIADKNPRKRGPFAGLLLGDKLIAWNIRADELPVAPRQLLKGPVSRL